MTREEAITQVRLLRDMADTMNDNRMKEATDMAINALRTDPCEDCISRQRVLDIVEFNRNSYDGNDAVVWIEREIKELPSVQPEPKKGYINIADVMSVFNDFMCDEVDEEGTEIFLEMLKDKAVHL